MIPLHSYLHWNHRSRFLLLAWLLLIKVCFILILWRTFLTRNSFLALNISSGSAPCKPPRAQKNGRSESADSIGQHQIDFDEIQLQEKPSEVDREVCMLMSDMFFPTYLSPIILYLSPRLIVTVI